MDSLIEKHPNKIASALGIAVLLFVFQRLEPTLPTIMGDELVYMVQSRHTDLSELSLPNYLFSFLYSSSLLVGTEYYWFVKAINFVFLFGFGAVMFLLSKKILGFWLALLVAISAVAGPASLYGSVFMPEAMYIFFASLSLYLVLQIPARPLSESWKFIAAAGLSIAVASLVKPHALFLLLGFGLFLIFSSKWRTLGLGKRLTNLAVFFGSVISLKLILGFVLAGPSGLTLFGGYGSIASLFERFLVLLGLSQNSTGEEQSSGLAEQIEPSEAASFFELTAQQFGLHFLAIGFLLAPAWYIFFGTTFSEKSSLAELGLFTLGTMMLIISAFGAYVTLGGDDHTDRILLRYYEFLIPIVFLGAFQVLKQRRPQGVLKFTLFGVFLFSAIVIAADGIFDTRKILSDSSYLLGIFENLDMRWFYSAALIVAFLFILGNPDRVPQYTAATIAVATLFAGFSSQQRQLDINSKPVGSDFAGQYIRDELPDVPGEEIYVVGSNKQLVEASIFWMDRPGVEFELYNAGSVLPDSEIPEDKSVIVQVMGVQIENIEEGDLIEEDWIISYR